MCQLTRCVCPEKAAAMHEGLLQMGQSPELEIVPLKVRGHESDPLRASVLACRPLARRVAS